MEKSTKDMRCFVCNRKIDEGHSLNVCARGVLNDVMCDDRLQDIRDESEKNEAIDVIEYIIKMKTNGQERRTKDRKIK